MRAKQKVYYEKFLEIVKEIISDEELTAEEKIELLGRVF